MWIEQILQVTFVAKAVGSVAFVSVSFFPNACIYRLLAEPDNLLNVSMMNSQKGKLFWSCPTIEEACEDIRGYSFKPSSLIFEKKLTN